eukprot:m.89385 g.89385  ORF g.89385 m.89385 type:complete len:162 (-) comp8532_c0_seq2:191-676(-)
MLSFCPRFALDLAVLSASHASLRQLNIADERIIHANTALPLEESCKDYERQLVELTSEHPVDLILLNLDSDGSVMTMFRDEKFDDAVSYVQPIPPHSPGDGTHISTTLPFLNTARDIAFIVMGDENAQVVKEALQVLVRWLALLASLTYLCTRRLLTSCLF